MFFFLRMKTIFIFNICSRIIIYNCSRIIFTTSVTRIAFLTEIFYRCFIQFKYIIIATSTSTAVVLDDGSRLRAVVDRNTKEVKD